jgi:hypothetical protein
MSESDWTWALAVAFAAITLAVGLGRRWRFPVFWALLSGCAYAFAAMGPQTVGRNATGVVFLVAAAVFAVVEWMNKRRAKKPPAA